MTNRTIDEFFERAALEFAGELRARFEEAKREFNYLMNATAREFAANQKGLGNSIAPEKLDAVFQQYRRQEHWKYVALESCSTGTKVFWGYEYRSSISMDKVVADLKKQLATADFKEPFFELKHRSFPPGPEHALSARSFILVTALTKKVNWQQGIEEVVFKTLSRPQHKTEINLDTVAPSKDFG